MKYDTKKKNKNKTNKTNKKKKQFLINTKNTKK